MDFVTLREFRTSPGKVWEKLAAEQELVVTRNGRPFAILTETSGPELEQDLKGVRAARAATAVQQLRRQAARDGLNSMPSDAIDSEIGSERQRRHDKSSH